MNGLSEQSSPALESVSSLSSVSSDDSNHRTGSLQATRLPKIKPGWGPMSQRERWVRTMHFQTVDRLPYCETGYWEETLPAWHRQGLPSHVNSDSAAHVFFACDAWPFGAAPVGINVGLCPPFQKQVIQETDEYRIIVDELGVKQAVHKDGSTSIPGFLEYPIKNRKDWNEFKKRLDPDDPGRYPGDWDERIERLRRSDLPVSIPFYSLFGKLRDWMGFEGISLALYDDPLLVEDMMEHITQLSIKTMERALTEVQVDVACGWEDMCFNHGPIISPEMFRRLLMPRYKRITSFLRVHGVDVVLIDSDGNINDIVELWLDSGVNCMFPLEVQSGSDPVTLRRRFGDRILLHGGVNKRVVAKGKEEIKAEMKRLEPVIQEGGFVPHLDHGCPPDIPYENYRYYLELKKKVLGFSA